MSTVIQVENVSKKYLLNHQQISEHRSLREEIMKGLNKVGGLFSKKKSRTKEVDIFWALKNVSFSINSGERVGIIGRNGAGKSTILKILSRVTKPTTGNIKLVGKLGSLLEVGTGFHPELSGRENVFLNGAVLGMSRKEVQNKFAEIVEFAEVQRFLDTPVKYYSSGMYVRLAFSIAAHFEPDLLILDEVLAVGDQQFQKKCFERIQSMGKKEGQAVIIVSHSVTTLASLCSRCLFFESGTLAYDGSMRQGINLYLNETTPIKPMLGSIVSLDSWKKREGLADRAKIAWVQLDNPNKALHVGADLIVRFSLQIPDHLNGDDLIFSLNIYNSAGNQVAHLLNSDSHFKPGILRGEHVFEICIQDLRLYPGTYSLGICIAEKSKPIDHAIECVQFDIQDGGSTIARELQKDCNMFYLTAAWKSL